jgi:hypothetical protein
MEEKKEVKEGSCGKKKREEGRQSWKEGEGGQTKEGRIA